MNIPSIPTDNLYKFQSIASLIVIVTWVYALVNVFDIAMRSSLEVMDAQARMENAQKMYEISKGLNDIEEKRWEHASQIGASSTEEHNESFDTGLAEYLVSINTLASKLHDLSEENVDYSVLAEKHMKTLRVLDFTMFGGGIVSVFALGFMLSVLRNGE